MRFSNLLFLLCILPLGACGKDDCEKGYEKMQDCVQSMDCAKVGPALSAQCQGLKNQYQVSYSLYQTACTLPDGSRCSCEGSEEERWQRILNCTLQPENLCQCR